MKIQKNQTVFIGDNHSLRVVKIDVMNDEVQLQLTNDDFDPERVNDFTMQIGNNAQLTHDVRVSFKTINEVGVQYIMLGFDAPRKIKIIGDWKTGNRDSGPANREKLSRMAASSLLYYASNNAQSALEHELVSRLKSMLKR